MQQIGVSVLLVRERAKVGSAAQREGRLAEACMLGARTPS
jgi:hypothetical protein